MTESNKNILKAVLDTIPEASGRIDDIIDFVERRGKYDPESAKRHGKLMSCVEVAREMNRTTQTIKNWVNKKILTPARLPGSTKIAGYFEEDVELLKRKIRETA